MPSGDTAVWRRSARRVVPRDNLELVGRRDHDEQALAGGDEHAAAGGERRSADHQRRDELAAGCRRGGQSSTIDRLWASGSGPDFLGLREEASRAFKTTAPRRASIQKIQIDHPADAIAPTPTIGDDGASKDERHAGLAPNGDERGGPPVPTGWSAFSR